MVNAVNPLPAPDLPQMTKNCTISLNDLKVAGGIFVRIREYEDAACGDYISVLWDNKPVKEYLVEHGSSDFPIILVISSDLRIGAHYINYTSKDANNNTGTSVGFNVNIISGKPEIIYAPPIFSDAVNGVINQSSIQANGGTYVNVAPYPGIAANDTVTLFWKGSSASGDIKNGGVESHVILADDIISGARFLIPETKLEPLKDKGFVTAIYQVRRNELVMGVSEFSKATLDLNGGGDGLSMIISTGAVNTDYDAIHLHPFNQGVVRGSSGSKVILSVVGNAVFDESGAASYQSVLNESGQSFFKLRSAEQGNAEISAEAASKPGSSIQQIVRFGPYKKGNGNIEFLNYSTGAPANGLTPCSIYLKTVQSSGLRAEITRVRVTVSGSAVIDGYPDQSADILLNSDKSAEIDIINSVAENVNVELSLPESSGSINRISLIFKSF